MHTYTALKLPFLPFLPVPSLPTTTTSVLRYRPATTTTATTTMLSAARPRLIAIKAARPFSSTSYVSSDSQVDRFPTSEHASSEHTSSPRPDRRRDYRDFVPRKPVPQNLTPGDYYTFKNGEWEESGPLPPNPQTRVVREPAPKTPTEKDMAPTDYTWRDNSWSATPEQKKIFAMRKNKSAERFPDSFFPDATKAIRLTAPEGMEPIPEGVKKRTFTILPKKRLMRHIPPTVPRRPGVPESVAGGENEVVKAVQETKRKYIDSYEKVPLKTLVAEMVKRGIGKKGMKIEVWDMASIGFTRRKMLMNHATNRSLTNSKETISQTW
jgi:hypothetical protein